MRDLPPSEILSISALLLIGLLVALVSGGLDPLLDFLNTNSGAVMAVATTVTALATGVLAWLNRSTLKLYELERKRDAANQVRIKGRCRHTLERVDALLRGWKGLLDRRGIDDDLSEEEKKEKELHGFEIMASTSRERVKDLQRFAELGAQECRDPESARKLGEVRRLAYERKVRLPHPDQGTTRERRDRWARVSIDQLTPLQEALQRAVEALEDSEEEAVNDPTG